MASNPQVSVVIIAQNEAERIEAAADSCRPFAEEILVVDGGSTDDTVAVAERAGCRVLSNPWPGYAQQRNVGAQAATHDWVLMLDADEVVSRELAQSLVAWKRAEKSSFDAYAINRIGDFFDKWLTGADEWIVRLYNSADTGYAETPVHEILEVAPERVGRLEGVLWHYGFRSVEDHVTRFNRYTSLEAAKAFEAGRRFSIFRMIWRPPAKFVQKYVVHRQYKQGLAGFVSAWLWVHYALFTEIKLYELKWRRERSTGAKEQELKREPGL